MRLLLTVIALVAFPSFLRADPIVLDFENLEDSEILTGQIPGFSFSNAIALTSGISLNEFEFPPRSGGNAISDDGGPIQIDFTDPVRLVGGYFTYLSPLIMTAFDSTGAELGTATSRFASNMALSGDVGSAPNELLYVAAANIAYVTIASDPLGGSLTVDDLTVQPVPEPGTLALVAIGGIGMRVLRRRRREI